ncbi:MAG: alkaline phosphatase family protein, partial [Candidatus Abyssubacteria bacterium]|nr:alkaline phosphatase family protein [Candidatus Abyssubacteria bacterium]
LGEYVIAVPFQRYDERHTDIFIEDIIHCLDQRTRYGLEIFGRANWDLFMIVFTSTDYVQHAMWDCLPEHLHSTPDRKRKKLADRLMDFYRKLDASVGSLLDGADENTQVFIISDHGFGPLEKKFFVSAWLEQLGLLHFSKGVGPAMRRLGVPVLSGMRAAAAKLDRYDLRHKLRRGSRRVALDKVYDFIDWSKTKAICGSYSEQGIYINTQGVWPNGIVSPGREYEEVRDHVISELRNLKDPDTGATIAVECHRREEVYSGDHVSEAPDIIFMVDSGACIADNMPSKVLFEKPNRIHGTGFHRLEGMLIASGKGIRKNKTISGARIIDMAPTLLYSMGLEIPHDADGSVLRDLFEPGFASDRAERVRDPAVSQAAGDEAYSDEDSKIIEERLRGLGYL